LSGERILEMTIILAKFFGSWLHYLDTALQCLNPGGTGGN